MREAFQMLQLRHFAASVDNHEVPGLLICGSDKPEAITVAEMARDYYETPGSKPSVTIGFRRTGSGTCTFYLNFPEAGHVQIDGVEMQIAEKLVNGLRHASEYIVMLAFGDEPTMISPDTFILMRGLVEIDGVAHFGDTAAPFDRMKLLREMQIAVDGE